MTVLSALARFLILAALALGINGCSPMGGGPQDEEKDPFYLEGKSKYASLDREGAINAYEKALISNPKSAAAHRELGFLYEERGNHTAALYHFERHLELRPESNLAETIKQHIYSCKLELTRGISSLVLSGKMQDEMRKLSATNEALNEQVSLLKTQLVEQATTYSNKLVSILQAQSASRATSPAPVEPQRRTSASERASLERSTSMSTPTVIKPTAATLPTSHIVRSGETFASISRKYNLRLSALQAANPGIDSRRLKAGQMILLPRSKN